MSQDSQYTPRFLEAAKNYLANYRSMGQAVPTVEGLARVLEYAPKTLYKWAEDNELFGNALTAIKTEQFLVLFNEGLQGKLNPVITKLMLSANHGMAERSEQKTEITGKLSLSKAISEADAV